MNERIRFDRFPIGAWSCAGFQMDRLDEEEVKKHAECGLTLTLSPPTDGSIRAKTLAALDLCARYGLKMILCDRRTAWQTAFTDPGKYRLAVREAVRDYGAHPAVAGFFLGDEPSEDQLGACAEAHRIFVEEAPGLLPYVNQYPDFAEKCRKFVLQTGCRFVSFDRYDQMNEGNDIGPLCRDLVEFRRVAEEANVPLFVILLSVGHYRYRVPNEDDLRWQMNVSLAHGANGIFWFTFYTPKRNNNYRTAPISEFGDRTPTFYAMRNLHLRFLRDYADLFNTARFRGAYWFEKPVEADEPFHEGITEAQVLSASSERGLGGFVSFFDGGDAYEGKHFVMITNGSPDKPDLFSLTVPGNVRHVYRVYQDAEVDFEINHHDARWNRTEESATVGVYLAPGQFELFRFEY